MLDHTQLRKKKAVEKPAAGDTLSATGTSNDEASN
jgi:hypothetical protein